MATTLNQFDDPEGRWRVSRPALRYFGGAWLRAAWIAAFFPPAGGPGHRGYLEPCAGAASVLFHKPPCKVETLNDLDGRVVNFFRVLRDRPAELIEAIELTPWGEDEYHRALRPCRRPLEDARRFFLICWASVRGGPNPGPGDFRWQKALTRRSAATQDVARLDQLHEAAARLRRTQIMNRDALDLIGDVIHADKTGDYLIYFDPPYLHGTRTNRRGYRHEVDDDWHVAAAGLLRRARGPVVVSGYPSPLYAELYEAHGWRRYERPFVTNSGGKRMEAVWVNWEG